MRPARAGTDCAGSSRASRQVLDRFRPDVRRDAGVTDDVAPASQSRLRLDPYRAFRDSLLVPLLFQLTLRVGVRTRTELSLRAAQRVFTVAVGYVYSRCR